MATLGATLNIGNRALYALQQAIDVTGNNIANANTEGYSRQRAVLETAPPIHTPIGPEGTGVTATGIERIVDPFIDPQINAAIQDQGQWDASRNMLQRVEIVFNESQENGLNASLSEFWNAWQDLANNPTGYTERTTLVAKAETLAIGVNQVYAELAQIQKDIDESVDNAVVQINTMADQITALNEQIHTVENIGGNANDQRDRRDELLRSLSEFIDFTSTETNDGRIAVTLGDGKQLVGPAPFGRLTTVTDAGHKDVVWDSAPGVDLNPDIGGGKLRGWLQVRDETLQGYIQELNAIFTDGPDGLAARVNSLHQAGYDLNGDPGLAFFTGANAGQLAVNTAIGNDPDLIAATADPAGVPGGSDLAIEIAGLQNTLALGGGSATYDDVYNGLVRDTGIQVSTADSNADSAAAMVTYLKNFRESVSGVSLDEEMVNLVKFQHAYDAAAKLISTVDEMLATVIAMV